METMREKLLNRSIPEPNSGCWLWIGSVWPTTDRPSVGGGKSALKVSASRAAYQEFVGAIPEGMLVCHRCDVPICVNPDHLFVGTQRDNMQDMIRKGRKGNSSGPIRTTEAQRAHMRKRRHVDGAAIATIASEVGFTKSTVRRYVGFAVNRKAA